MYKKFMEIAHFSASVVDDPTIFWGFMKLKGILEEYCYKCKDRQYFWDINETKPVMLDTDDLTEFIIDGDRDKKCYSCYERRDKDRMGTAKDEMWYVVYVEKNPIENDSIFTWKYNMLDDCHHALIKDSLFEFDIVYDNKGMATIDIRYIKCKNRHRTKVTMEQIILDEADNEKIFNAITQWKNELVN